MTISSDQTTSKTIMTPTREPTRRPATAATTVNGLSQLSSLKSSKRSDRRQIQSPMTPKFVLEMTREAAAKSFLILKKYGFKLKKATNTQKLSPLGYGCKFRPPKTLQQFFLHHPL
jgi:hypothetical protein